MKRAIFFLCIILIFTGSTAVFAGCKAKEYEALSIASEALRKAGEMKTDDGTEAYFYFDSSPNKDNKKIVILYIPDKNDFVNVKKYIPGIYVDLKYSTTDNFTGNCVYDFSEAYLRYGTVEKLRKVYQAVAADGYSLKIWDAFRPVVSQFKLWEIYPDSRYVANPNTGFSKHSRGNTIDITLVKADGSEVEMPSAFDEFSVLADRDYSDCTETAKRNAAYLENMMITYGFKAYFGEWWHFSDADDYPVEEEYIP